MLWEQVKETMKTSNGNDKEGVSEEGRLNRDPNGKWELASEGGRRGRGRSISMDLRAAGLHRKRARGPGGGAQRAAETLSCSSFWSRIRILTFFLNSMETC